MYLITVKVTFVEENQQEHQAPQCIGGSGGRQLVPGVLPVTDQSSTGFQKQKDVAGGDKPIQVQQQQIKGPSPIQVTFVEQNQQEHQAPQCIGGSGGRQLVPGVLPVTDQSSTGFQKQKDAAGGDKPIEVQQQQIEGPPPIQTRCFIWLSC
ncbi:unnamed protein product [Acanthoscelides obtectus]|uniref:Uncharacterized protein n=1 Tax=Acanthoscelides obtectus TaxID=200917 RepID=A0A9P0PV06_ACAOB|nr:unnamed protein product [Acanthoscelides obtectus]CAK1628683.1 hypothetical protein AOBTE_LOCUS5345 [Acanthoscelides obtectus]